MSDNLELRLEELDNQIIIRNIKDFDTKQTFECGQAFRWFKQPDSSYTGVVGGHVFNVNRNEDSLIVKSDLPNLSEVIMKYLDIKKDYLTIKEKLSQDKVMRKAIEYGNGIRILRQEYWECLASFIISANNRIPMIKRAVESISRSFGNPTEFNGKVYYSFPPPEVLINVDEDKLSLCGVGFRCKYIKHAAQMTASGEIDLKAIEEMDSSSAREELMKIPGVGPKIADCVLLYSYGKSDVFPTDVWIKRVVEALYFKRKTKLPEIQEFAQNKFGSLSGFAQQYLFYYARENKIGAGQK